jgi:hypothetical protein
MIRKGVLAIAAISALAWAAPDPAAAQSRLAVSALAGAYVPGGSFRELQDAAGELERGSTLGLGLNLHLGMLRVSTAYATGATISEDGVDGESEIGDGSVLTATADLVLRPLPRLIVVQPYVLGGVGYKRESYSIDAQGFPDELDDPANEVVGHLGLGVDISLGGLTLVAEVSDFIGRNNNDSWKVHDAFGMVGLKFNLF